MFAEHPLCWESRISPSGNFSGRGLLLGEVERKGFVGRILLGTIEEGYAATLFVEGYLPIFPSACFDLLRLSFGRIEGVDARLERVVAGEGEASALGSKLIG